MVHDRRPSPLPSPAPRARATFSEDSNVRFEARRVAGVARPQNTRMTSPRLRSTWAGGRSLRSGGVGRETRLRRLARAGLFSLVATRAGSAVSTGAMRRGRLARRGRSGAGTLSASGAPGGGRGSGRLGGHGWRAAGSAAGGDAQRRHRERRGHGAVGPPAGGHGQGAGHQQRPTAAQQRPAQPGPADGGQRGARSARAPLDHGHRMVAGDASRRGRAGGGRLQLGLAARLDVVLLEEGRGPGGVPVQVVRDLVQVRRQLVGPLVALRAIPGQRLAARCDPARRGHPAVRETVARPCRRAPGRWCAGHRGP